MQLRRCEKVNRTLNNNQFTAVERVEFISFYRVLDYHNQFLLRSLISVGFPMRKGVPYTELS